MIHIRNSKPNSVFTLEHDGIPTSLLTDFNETIINGSLCIDTVGQNIYQLRYGVWVLIGSNTTINLSDLHDVNITNIQNGDIIVYNSASTSWINTQPSFSGTTGIIQTNYNTLCNMSSSGTLQAGSYYQFDYQTIHLIPYTNELHYGAIEKLVVFAISNTNIDYLAHSLARPYDIIHYRSDDKFVNMGSNPYSPLTRKPGIIYYREDTINRLSAPYDFREVTYRRWELQHPYVVTSPTKTFHDNTSLLLGDVIVDTDNTIYVAKFSFNCSTTGTVLNNPNFFYNLTEVIDNSFLSSVYTNYTSHYGTNFSCATPNNFVFIDNTGSGYSDIVLQVKNTSYRDYKTFDNVFKKVSPGISFKSYNCHIKNHIPAYYESVANEYYPNVVMTDFCNNVSVGQFAENLTIIESTNVTIGDYSLNMFITTYNSILNYTEIGSRCENIFIQNTYGTEFEFNHLFHKIDNANKNIINYNVANVEIGEKNISLFMFYTQSCSVGSKNKFIGYFGKSGPICTNNDIKNHNSDISFSFNTYNNYVGSGNTVLVLPVSSNNNTFGNSNNNINGFRAQTTSIEGVATSNIFNNIVGNNNNNISLAGRNNTYDNNITDLYCDNSASYSYCNFKSGTGNLSIISSITGSQIIATTFDFSNIYLGSLRTLDIDTQTSSINFLNFNMAFTGNSTAGAFKIINVISPTTDLILLNLV